MPGRPELAERNRRIVLMRNNRMRLREIAAAFGISIVRVHVICRREQERRARDARVQEVTDARPE